MSGIVKIENGRVTYESEPESWDFRFDFSFVCRSGSTLDSIRDRLSDMKQDDFFELKPGTFTIWYFHYEHWNQDLLEIFVDLFEHFHEKRIVWEKLEIGITEYNERFALPLIKLVNNTKIFKRVHLFLDSIGNRSFDGRKKPFQVDKEEHIDLCPDIASNDFTEELKIECFYKISERGCLAFNNLLEANPPCLKKLRFTCITRFDHRRILQGLRNNRTFKEVEFLLHDRTTDKVTSKYISAIASNPNLEVFKLCLMNAKNGGDLTSEAVKKVLSDCTSLRELCLYSDVFRVERTINAECIIQGMKNCPSLKKLIIGGILYGDLIFSRFFRILSDYPMIEFVWLEGYAISEEDIAQAKSMPRLPRPIHLRVGKCPGVEKLETVLRYHPEVRLSHGYSDNKEFLHIADMNWFGKYLLDRPKVPISIWPRVLEKVNDNDHVKDKVSILYGLLQGPAWTTRTRV